MPTSQPHHRAASTLIGVLAFIVLALTVGALWSVLADESLRQVSSDAWWVLPVGIALIVGQALGPRFRRSV